MGQFLGSRIGKISLVLSSMILAGIAVFSAIRLYQLKQLPVETPEIYCQQCSEPASCTNLSLSKENPQIGDSVTVTCSGTPTTPYSRVEFQLSINEQLFSGLQNSTTTTAVIDVDQAGTYTVRCRWCATTDTNNCSAWQTL